MATLESERAWQRGISSWVRLAAWMPAMRAVASTSPLGRPPSASSARVSGCIRMRPEALASRRLSGLSATSTIWASPRALRWVSDMTGASRKSEQGLDGDRLAGGHGVALGGDLDQADGLHHGGEDARALGAGGSHAQPPLGVAAVDPAQVVDAAAADPEIVFGHRQQARGHPILPALEAGQQGGGDRKSTRLNSSHVRISY